MLELLVMQVTTGGVMSRLKANTQARAMQYLRWMYENDHDSFLGLVDYLNDVIKEDKRIVVNTSNKLFKRLMK